MYISLNETRSTLLKRLIIKLRHHRNRCKRNLIISSSEHFEYLENKLKLNDIIRRMKQDKSMKFLSNKPK